MDIQFSRLRACSLVVLVFAFGLHSQVRAESLFQPSLHPKLLAENNYTSSDKQHYLVAQTDPDEAFDPFTDYSEFDEESDEEADINFFRNGRFFTLGLAVGYRSFTDNMSQIYGPSTTYGLFLSYFFDLRFAFQLGFQTGDHTVNFSTIDQTSGGKTNYSGNVSLTTLNFDLKYYMNTQNVTRGLADLNPYFLLGFAQFYRTYTITNLDGYNRDSTMGFEFGAGLEVPLLRKKAYLGLQATYHYVNFNDENKNYLNGTERLTRTVRGDPYDLLVILGMNF